MARSLRRLAGLTVASAASLCVLAAPAFAHAELTPNAASASSTVTLKLFVEDEESSAGITKVQLAFPEQVIVVDTPAPSGWTATVDGGSLGTAASGITWSGPALPGDANLTMKITLGPLTGKKAFKVVETYDNGTTNSWIGAEGSDNPAAFLSVEAAGVTPTTTAVDSGHDHDATATTASDHDHASETTMDHSAGHEMEHGATTTTEAKKSGDSNTGTVIGIVGAAVVIIGGGAALAMRRKPSAPSGPSES